ncbi:hypothetical protein [Streptomyces mirabilis]|uniref:hypothetical protein n=1 Tax=Streptomyces mirabilis TaxID=68239 RepID=UPI000B08298C|nr:hypothetical protein [Streptomyces mirabilis]MCX4428442.1 hypothetical protein [Streptomyces mirabilis]
MRPCQTWTTSYSPARENVRRDSSSAADHSRSKAGGAAGKAPVTAQPYAVRFSAPAAKVLDTLPRHVEDTVWDVLDAAAADPWGFGQWNADDPEGEDVRYASVGQLSLTAGAWRAEHARQWSRRHAATTSRGSGHLLPS